MYDFILFDLDGTIINSEKGVSNSLLYAFDKCGITYSGDLRKFIGPPFIKSFPEFLGVDKETTMRLVGFYREIYNKVGVFQTTLYRGIRDLLVSLKSSGKKVALATSKPKFFAEIILKKKRIYKLFDFVAGSELDGSVSQKDEVLNIIFEKTDFVKSKSVLIGDTVYDCMGANKVGLDCIGVAYGFGKSEDMLAHGAIQVAESVKELKKILL